MRGSRATTTYTLESKKGLKVELLPFGARIAKIKYRQRTLTSAYPQADQYLQDPYCIGATIGPIANRIANAEYFVKNRLVKLAANEGKNCLHSGELGFHRRIWQAREVNSKSVEFFLESTTAQGYACNLQAVAHFQVQENALIIDYRVSVDQPAYINLTNHAYFNLNQNQAAIHNHRITLHADAMVQVDKQGIPTGKFKSLTRPFVHLPTKVLPADAIDNHFVTKSDINDISLTKLAEIEANNSPIKLSVHSTKPGFQLYLGQKLAQPFKPFAGLCIEPQYPPNIINSDPCAAPIVTPDNPYHHQHRYTFELQ